MGTWISCDGGATDDSANEIGVCVGLGCSILSDFMMVPFRIMVEGTSSSGCM